MLSFFKERANNRRDENELADLRIMLSKVNELIGLEELPEDNLLFVAQVGFQIRKVLEHRFGSTEQTSIHSDDDLADEENLIDDMSYKDLDDIYQRITKNAHEGVMDEDSRRTTALVLLSGWLKSKLIARRSRNQAMVAKARDHEELHLTHIRNMLRAIRGERLITD